MALCSQCKIKKSIPEFRPFCSKRCADLDLHAWFNGDYAIAVVENDGNIEGDFEEREDIDISQEEKK